MTVSKNNKSLAWLVGAICLYSASNSPALVSCGPNSRSQAASENLANSAPYLLSTFKQAEAFQPANSSQQQVSPRHNASDESATGNRLAAVSSPLPAPAEVARTNGRDDEGAANLDDEREAHNFSVIKEETVEEIVDLESDAVLKLSPDSGAPASESSGKLAGGNQDLLPAAAESKPVASVQSFGEQQDSQLEKMERKPQLPVTSSHLKRPLLGVLDDDLDHMMAPAGSQRQPLAAASANDTGVLKSGTGAKSLVSPSVAAELEPAREAAPQAGPMKKRLPAVQPDTLEPSQIMNGVTNASAVPAIVSKEYGHQTRTRITLGGGYVRDRLPPLSKPGSGTLSSESRPEKPVAPLERPSKKKSGGSDGSAEMSRVVEVPDRIVAQPSAQKLGDEQAASNKVTAVVEGPEGNETSATPSNKGSPDPRCPKSGSLTFGHATACDRYYYCEDGHASEQVCPNGLMYGTRDTVLDFCVHRWRADCEDKTIPNPISSPGCRWQYGVFNVQGSPKCSPDFYECAAGKFEVKKCSIDGQVYDDRTKSCQFAEQVGCAKSVLADFQCPPDDQANTYWPFPRYFFNERALIHCVNDKPEIIRCTEDQRVDPEHLHCIPLAKWNLQQSGAAANLDARKTRLEKKKASQ